jgi:hypothetical protein
VTLRLARAVLADAEAGDDLDAGAAPPHAEAIRVAIALRLSWRVPHRLTNERARAIHRALVLDRADAALIAAGPALSNAERLEDISKAVTVCILEAVVVRAAPKPFDADPRRPARVASLLAVEALGAAVGIQNAARSFPFYRVVIASALGRARIPPALRARRAVIHVVLLTRSVL